MLLKEKRAQRPGEGHEMIETEIEVILSQTWRLWELPRDKRGKGISCPGAFGNMTLSIPELHTCHL